MRILDYHASVILESRGGFADLRTMSFRPGSEVYLSNVGLPLIVGELAKNIAGGDPFMTFCLQGRLSVTPYPQISPLTRYEGIFVNKTWVI